MNFLFIKSAYRNLCKQINNILKAVLILAVFFIIPEFFLRIRDPFQFRFEGNKIILPIYMQYRISNDRIPGLDKIIVHTKNSLGFRGTEPPEDFKDYLTIITMGASDMECFYVSDKKTWPEILEMHLAKIFNKTWVNNAALDGLSSFGNVILLKNYIIQGIKPKVILLSAGGGDVGLEEINKYDNTLVVVRRSQNVFKNILELCSHYSKVVSVSINLYKNYQARRLGIGHREFDLKNTEYVDFPQEAQRQLIEMHKRRFLPYYEARLKEFIQICRAYDIQLIFITMASFCGKGYDEITGIDLARMKVDKRNGETEWSILELYNDVTRGLANKENLPLIDLAHEMPKNSRFFYNYTHYTNEGSQKVAEIVFKHLSPFLVQHYTSFVKQ